MTEWETILSLVGAAVGVALARMVVILVLRVALTVAVVLVLANVVWQHGTAEESASCPLDPVAEALPAPVAEALPVEVDGAGCVLAPPP